MARAFGTTLLLFLLATAGSGCDSAGDPDPSSRFARQDLRARDVLGVVRRGEDLVPGAGVRVAPAPETSTFRNVPPVDTSTDSAGFYRVGGSVPSIYDLTLKLPGGPNGRDDLLLFRALAARYHEPQIEVPVRSFARAWKAKLDVRFDAPIPPGQVVQFLAGGDAVYGATGDLATGLTVQTGTYTAKAVVHAILYTPEQGLNSAYAYGRTEVFTDAATTKIVTFHLDPITADRPTPTFEVAAPPGFVPGNVDVVISVSRTSDARLVSIPYGTLTSLAPIPNMDFFIQVRATRADGAFTDSGELRFDRAGTTKLELTAPPELTAPAESLGAGDVLSVTAEGAIEHVFEPTATNQASLRIVQQAGAETAFPDVRAVSVTTLTGLYTWTVRSFPTYEFSEGLYGVDSRRFRPFAVTAPRPVTLR